LYSLYGLTHHVSIATPLTILVSLLMLKVVFKNYNGLEKARNTMMLNRKFGIF